MIARVTYTGRRVRLILAPESEREHAMLLMMESRPLPPLALNAAGTELETVIDLVATP